MKFSVIVPVYNAREYLTDCVKSVLMQDFADFEIILVNDGSTDGSEALIEELAREDNRVRRLTIPNSGANAARLEGLMAARGDYILYLDADDAWESSLLSRVNRSIEVDKPEMVMFAYRRVPGGEDRAFKNSGFLTREEIRDKIMGSSELNMVWDKAVPREKAVRLKIEPRHRGVAEDLLMMLPILDECKRIYYINEPLYRYRAVKDSRSHGYRSERHREINFVRERVMDWMMANNLADERGMSVFFGYYLDRMADCLVRASRAEPDKAKLRAIFREVRAFPLYRAAKGRAAQLSKKRRLQLRLVDMRLDRLFAFLARR